ncbi:4-hydroxybenzoate 3-monooxygenase [Amycolatopsis oliviviridis]|uniref:4-hydroxybenzoate 3-monooxygenase n=2 Tax=Amycolatopsis oliviviridis TaxID=1471590 RepID=A0ABQ3L5M6_9PSEU|nr:4-hydroxybenzoate 3-monooxygenase [Amycolatopsis oliviviridis]
MKLESMSTAKEHKPVVIVGAGVSGLALGNFLLREGIDCVVLERRDRDHVERRQRAGVIDTRATRAFRKRGLEDRVVGGTPVQAGLGFRIDGQDRWLELPAEEYREGRFCPQQVLVRNLITVFEQDGGDLRFGTEVTVEDIDRPRVRLGDGSIIEGDFIAGCDGSHGATRAAIPENRLTRHSHEYGYAWLVVLAEVPAVHPTLLAIHRRGFAAQFGRGPTASRFYLQCPLDDTAEDWPDERVWSELETRFGEPIATRGPIVEKQPLPLRGEVLSPMSHGGLHLLGDAAHIVPPSSAKGMNLALYDADVFAEALVGYYRHDDPSLLAAYSDNRLRDVWNYQAFATWFTDTVHDAGDATYRGEFRHQVARADFERLFTSGPANRLLGEFIAGLN